MNESKKYNFRLAPAVRQALDAIAPPERHQRSAFVRDAIDTFLQASPVPLKGRARRPSRHATRSLHQQTFVVLDTDMVDRIKSAYPRASISVVIEAAIIQKLGEDSNK